ncbi:MAG: arsenic resistance protein [Nitrososphaerota archaeon]|nr:arsenic resistance protein [Nitrososphaerota archaeon]
MAITDAHHLSRLHLVSEHVRKYLILYTLLSVLIAIPVGYYSSAFTATNKELFSNLVIFLAILTIYPSMIQLKTEGLANSFRSWRAMIISLIYVFILSPIIAFALAPTFGNSEVGLGFVTANIVPASSASLGYVLIAGGSIELATALAVLSLVIAIPAIPFFLSLYGSQVSTSVPILPVMMSVVYILVLPFIAGQLTRYPVMKKKGASFVNKTIRPYLSLATMLSMFALIFVLVEKEASVMITKPQLVGYVIGFQSAIIIGILLVSIVVSRAMHLSYEDHQAVAFISVTKNQSVAAAIATMALNPVSALAPAIIPMIQPVIAIVYIHLEKPIRKLFERPGTRIPREIESSQENK